ncbi:hypothetical protein LPB140_00215 [Sphingorhabdus lutea]|uniref:Methylhydantoinase n=1 Tax=Sphingorhabdus lutea TaxID=1913578 RepID=A0A1L3J8S0_9SPHN|nr:Imm32 family immunity protein [Sphingorhabdus lutea]APG61525.1 hypothetical protein LPB140_00215 [Sphingorhabdus lutea]
MTIDRTLSFELSNDGDEIDIHFNEAGLDDCISILQQAKMPGFRHEHLMTHSWGGEELTEEVQCENAKLIHKVTIHKWK